MLAKEVIAVVEGAGADLDCEVLRAWEGSWDCLEGEAGRGLLARLFFFFSPQSWRAVWVEVRAYG